MGNSDLGHVYTNEEIANNPNMYRDEDGVHLIFPGGEALIEPSPEWIAKQNSYTEPPSEPTQEERILALEQALLNLLG